MGTKAGGEGGPGGAGGEGSSSDPDLISKQACTYAALILHDLNLKINEENINKLVVAAGVQGLKSYWPGLFVKLIEAEGMGKILANSIKGGGAGGAAAGPAEGTGETTGEEAAPAAGGMFGGSDSSDDDSDSDEDSS